MKLFIICLAVCLPSLVAAQDAGVIDQETIDSVINQVDPATVDAVVQQAQKVQACLAKLDQAEVARLKAEADAKASEIRAMCTNDERAEAQSQAVAFGKQLEQEPVVIEAKACIGIAGLAIPQTTWAQLEDSETAQTHVCDL